MGGVRLVLHYANGVLVMSRLGVRCVQGAVGRGKEVGEEGNNTEAAVNETFCQQNCDAAQSLDQ